MRSSFSLPVTSTAWSLLRGDDGRGWNVRHPRRQNHRGPSNSGPRGEATAMPIMTGLSGNEIFCLQLKGLAPGELVLGNSVGSLGFLGGGGAGFRDILRGEITQVTETISEGRHL